MVFSCYQHIKKFWMGAWSHQCQDTHKNALVPHARYGHILNALQEQIYVVIALQITLAIVIIILKGPH